MKGLPAINAPRPDGGFFSRDFRGQWRYLLLFDLFLLAVLILATRLATFLHEFIGHALLAAAFDGQVNGVRVSLFGGGKVFYQLPTEAGLSRHFLVAWGGIIVNMLSGLLPFVFIRRSPRRPGWALFFLLFGMVSLLGATAYCALGFYYDQGDPVAWNHGAVHRTGWLWIPFLVISPLVSYFSVKTYFSLNGSWFATRTFMDRVSVMILTLGVAGCAYAGLYAFAGQGSVALDTPASAQRRAEKEVRKIKREELFGKLRESYPELSKAEVQGLVERIPIVVRPEEIPKKIPLKPVIAVLFLSGALLALWRANEGISDPPGRLSSRSMLTVVALAAAVLLALIWTDGWLYRFGKGL
jgi:hypothetical protein